MKLSKAIGADDIREGRCFDRGWLGAQVAGRACRCTPEQVARYQGKLSGPLLDRIDLVVEVPALAPEALARGPAGEASALVRDRVQGARAAQLARQGCANADLPAGEVERHCRPDPGGETLLQQAMQRLKLSARAYHRVLRVARTLADLSGVECPGAAHIAEAIHYRSLDRRGGRGDAHQVLLDRFVADIHGHRGLVHQIDGVHAPIMPVRSSRHAAR